MSSARQATRPTPRPPPRPRSLAVVPVVADDDDEPSGELDTMVDLPAATPQSDIRELAVQRPPRPTPRSRPPEPKLAAVAPPPPPLPSRVASKTEPATATETDTIELDASCIEEACALAAAEPSSTTPPAPAAAARSPLVASALHALEHAVKAARRLGGFLRAVAFFVVFAATAAMGWLRATFFPATRAVAADARARLVIEWQRASERARSPAAERSTRVT